jgi:aspartate/methionine/tyrosine aminotransferase
MASVAEKSLLSPPDIGERRPRFRGQRTTRFTESVIREMTRLAAQHNAVNLAQGFPDFGSPEVLRKAACDAINADINQYAITWGSKSLRNAIAAKYKKTYNLEFDPEREITVCCGATEGMMASLMAVTNPGDEVVIFEPYYENYGPDTLLAGADRKFVKMHPPDWRFDREELRRAFSIAASSNISRSCARSSIAWPSPTKFTSTSSTMEPSTSRSCRCRACATVPF